MLNPHIYAVIIGSEILNGRRVDKHFHFLQSALAERGYTLYSVEIIRDDVTLMTSSFQRIKSDKKSMMFCFGGIGSTPDDLTRAVAAAVFRSSPPVRHKQFERDIIEHFGKGAYPNRIHMADLPEGACLLKNPVNNMSGFSLEERFFFMPGFPEMAHPMAEEAIAHFLPQNRTLYRQTLTARCSEDSLIMIMKEVPSEVECSSLPMFVDRIPRVEISVASYDADLTRIYFKKFVEYLELASIHFEIKTR
ncbi:MAG: competence/damage-inducible protein A [Thiovulaceae bacterium]|nr:competence/damage-inducible protein A [Sulfurimonadaceae bacterium]